MDRYSQRRLWALFIGCALLSACSSAPPTAEQAAPTSEPVPAVTAEARTPAPQPASAGLQNGVVVVNGRVLPRTSAELLLPSGAVIEEVLVSEGDSVAEGQPLVRLDMRTIELRIKEAETNLAEARAAYELLVADATPAQMAQASARIEQARANLRQVTGRVSEEDIAAARQEVEAARAALDELLAGPKAEDVAIAQSEVERTQAELRRVRDAAAGEKILAESRVERLANALRDSQAYYERVYWDNRQRYGEGELPAEAAANEAAALRAVQNAELVLNEGRIEFEQAQKNERNLIAAAEAEVVEAEARLRRLLAPPDASRVADAQSRLSAANAYLVQLSGQARAGAIELAEAELAEAEAAYAGLVADPTTPELALAEARVHRAELQLEQEQLRREQAVLLAPFAGVVADVTVEPGITIGDARVAVVLADFSSWQIETDSLNELSVVHVREGDKARITFFALPGFEIPGVVTHITTIGKTDSPSELTTNYRLTVTPDYWDERLRWNMTATVAIIPQN
ncbi:MAG: efflux RND transporter periplasmic adaptor subunit [Chloroflexi bacterium OHK40]